MSELTAMPSFHCMSTNWNQGAHNIPGVSMLGFKWKPLQGTVVIPFDTPGWGWAWSATPAANGRQRRAHSTVCAWLEGCLWTICCCLPPVLTQGHHQKSCFSQQSWEYNFWNFLKHCTATTYWHADKTAKPNKEKQNSLINTWKSTGEIW